MKINKVGAVTMGIFCLLTVHVSSSWGAEGPSAADQTRLGDLMVHIEAGDVLESQEVTWADSYLKTQEKIEKSAFNSGALRPLDYVHNYNVLKDQRLWLGCAKTVASSKLPFDQVHEGLCNLMRSQAKSGFTTDWWYMPSARIPSVKCREEISLNNDLDEIISSCGNDACVDSLLKEWKQGMLRCTSSEGSKAS